MSNVVLILVLPKVRYSSGFFQNVLFSFAFLQLECVWLNIVFIWISNLLIILWTSWTLCLSLILEIHWPLSFQIFFQLHSLYSPSLFHFWIHYNFYSYPTVIGYSLPLFFFSSLQFNLASVYFLVFKLTDSFLAMLNVSMYPLKILFISVTVFLISKYFGIFGFFLDFHVSADITQVFLHVVHFFH